ncbi:ABC transporter ATP-binding protein [Catelliglobosispora koreensis]|uniref:ABC transporter ATP-binding protein n=1 Tax=Catelliglobosispora koreensis TaxID=129052 RepID=UPI0003607EF7|nr:ABC transporter ATP-binding protein [Catelliglobosispora koreensis]
MILQLEGLTAGYGAAPVLRDIHLEVPQGSIVTVLGPNGAGKTTLLRTIAGLLKPTTGRILFDGDDLRGVRVEHLVRRGLALVPEGRGVITELTVEENLRLGGLWRKDSAATMSEVYELFEPLARRNKSMGHQLSGGERQMLAIGRALMARPRLLLLDEPSLGLAPKVTAQIMSLLRQLRDNDGLSVLLVEQNARSALSIADAAVAMSLGRLAETSSGDMRAAYLGS